MQKIVGVRRYKDREIYYFLQNIDNLQLKDKVVVNFDDFQTVVEVVKIGLETEDEKASELSRLSRIANKADIIKYESLIKKAEEYLPIIKTKSLELGLSMKFVSAEYSLDNSKIIIVFSSEERVDFRQFLKELASLLKIRIELKQIGQRDEVKACGGVGICGQECCCARFLNEFEHVTVKMAKNQGLSLSPTKINGICGRLMCCLAYESETYEKMLAKMPKVGSKIKTPSGEATVVYNDILREKVTVKRQSDNDSVVVEDFTLEELATGKKAVPEKQDKQEGNSQLDEFLKRNADPVPLENEKNKISNQKTENSSKVLDDKHKNSDNLKGNTESLSHGEKSQNEDNQNTPEKNDKNHGGKHFKHGNRDKSNNNAKHDKSQNEGNQTSGENKSISDLNDKSAHKDSQNHKFDRNRNHSRNFNKHKNNRNNFNGSSNFEQKNNSQDKADK